MYTCNHLTRNIEAAIGSGLEEAIDRPQSLAGSFVPSTDVVARLLAKNMNDYMSVGMFAYYIECCTHAPSTDLRRICAEYLEFMTTGGYVVVGSLSGDKLIGWTFPAAEIRDLVFKDWPSSGPPLFGSYGDIVWISNTAHGDAYATAHKASPFMSRQTLSRPGLS